MIGLMFFALLPVVGLIDVSAGHLRESVPLSGFVGWAADASQFSFAAQAGAGINAVQPVASYRLSGEKSLRPARISDDGVHMYLEWSEEQALPAVFALNAIGDEEMVDGYMRAGIFTIDRVHGSLVFRIGKKRALAKRRSK